MEESEEKLKEAQFEAQIENETSHASGSQKVLRDAVVSGIHYTSEQLASMGENELKFIMNQMLISTANVDKRVDMINGIVNAQLSHYLEE